MTGHRKPWIVRKNRRYRRMAFERWFLKASKQINDSLAGTGKTRGSFYILARFLR